MGGVVCCMSHPCHPRGRPRSTTSSFSSRPISPVNNRYSAPRNDEIRPKRWTLPAHHRARRRPTLHIITTSQLIEELEGIDSIPSKTHGGMVCYCGHTCSSRANSVRLSTRLSQMSLSISRPATPTDLVEPNRAQLFGLGYGSASRRSSLLNLPTTAEVEQKRRGMIEVSFEHSHLSSPATPQTGSTPKSTIGRSAGNHVHLESPSSPDSMRFITSALELHHDLDTVSTNSTTSTFRITNDGKVDEGHLAWKEI